MKDKSLVSEPNGNHEQHGGRPPAPLPTDGREEDKPGGQAHADKPDSQGNEAKKSLGEQVDANWVIAILTGALVFETAVSAFVSYLQWEVLDKTDQTLAATDRTLRETLIASHRAWVVPAAARIEGPLEAGKPVDVAVFSYNTGKEPARHVTHQSRGRVISVPEDPLGIVRLADVEWPDNNTCVLAVGNKPTDVLIYPSSEAHPYMSLTPAFADDGVPAELFEPVDLTRKPHVTIIIQGCFLYTTFTERAWSRYCFYARPEPGRPPAQWTFGACPVGQDAK